MSTEFSFDRGFINADPGVTIRRFENCRIVTGPVPMSEFSMVIHGFSDQAVMASDLASKMGVTFVIGEPEDLERLRQGLTININQPEDIERLKQSGLPISSERINDAEMAKKQNLPVSLIDWLVNGDRGLSSDAMCQAMFGIPKGQPRTDHPHDPSDLIRCLKFLKAAGPDELWRMDTLPGISLTWALLKNRWEELQSTLISETGPSFEGKKAPKTYELMNSIIKS